MASFECPDSFDSEALLQVPPPIDGVDKTTAIYKMTPNPGYGGMLRPVYHIGPEVPTELIDPDTGAFTGTDLPGFEHYEGYRTL